MPTANLRTVLAITTERGIAPEKVLLGTNLTAAMLEDTDLRIPARDAARLVANAYLTTGDPGLGMEFGLRTKVTAHGPLGLAAMACGNLREALDLVTRYLHTRQQDVALSVALEERQLVVRARDTHDIGPARRFIYEAMMIGSWHIAGFLLGEKRPDCELWFDWPEPPYFAAYRHRLPTVRYGMPSIELRLPASNINKRLITAEPEAMKRAVEECERELALAGAAPDNVAERVRAHLRRGDHGYPDLETVAGKLFMSGRTLKRKLEHSGTSFQALLDEARYRDAQRLLENPDLDIQQIATALGYTDPPSFTRAFKRWSGRTPSAARTR